MPLLELPSHLCPPLVSLSCQILPADASTSDLRPRRQRRARSCTLQTSRHSAWSPCDSVVRKVFFFLNRTWRFGEIFSEGVAECRSRTEPNFSELLGLFLSPFCHVISNLRSHLSSQIMPEISRSAISFSLSLSGGQAHTHFLDSFFSSSSSSISEQSSFPSKRAECD